MPRGRPAQQITNTLSETKSAAELKTQNPGGVRAHTRKSQNEEPAETQSAAETSRIATPEGDRKEISVYCCGLTQQYTNSPGA